MSNFTRHDEFVRKLAAIAAHFRPTVRRNEGAVVVHYADSAPQRRRSIGVKRLLKNYYRPTAAEHVEIENAPDPGKARSFAAFKHAVDAPTRGAKFEALAEARYADFDVALAAGHQLSAVDMIALPGQSDGEFRLGSASITVRERPEERAEWVHLTGSIDGLYYNKHSGRLVLVEQKSGKPGTGTGSKIQYASMATLFLKEQHAKQLCMYARLLLEMAKEARVALYAKDLELVHVANHTSRRMLSIWRQDYDPETFLCGTWQPDHWHGILDAGHLRCAVVDQRPCCQQCGAVAEPLVYEPATPTLRALTACLACANQNRCACGRIGRLSAKRSKTKICGRECPALATRQPQRPRSTSPPSAQPLPPRPGQSPSNPLYVENMEALAAEGSSLFTDAAAQEHVVNLSD